MENSPLSRRVIGYAIDLHRRLGPGLLESVYAHCLAKDLRRAGIPFDREVPIPVTYRGEQLDFRFRADLLIDETLIIEVKSVDRLLAVHTAQLLTYIKLARVPEGLLMNFNAAILRHGLKRVSNSQWDKPPTPWAGNDTF
ncbi:MAG: GxxExxY protein [Rhizomicrobium sp.]